MNAKGVYLFLYSIAFRTLWLSPLDVLPAFNVTRFHFPNRHIRTLYSLPLYYPCLYKFVAHFILGYLYINIFFQKIFKSTTKSFNNTNNVDDNGNNVDDMEVMLMIMEVMLMIIVVMLMIMIILLMIMVIMLMIMVIMLMIMEVMLRIMVVMLRIMV